MYRCESWTIKIAEHQKIEAFELWCWRTLESPLDCKKIKQSVLKEINPEKFIGRTDAKAEAPKLQLPDVKCQLTEKTLMLGKIEGKRRRGDRE